MPDPLFHCRHNGRDRAEIVGRGISTIIGREISSRGSYRFQLIYLSDSVPAARCRLCPHPNVISPGDIVSPHDTLLHLLQGKYERQKITLKVFTTDDIVIVGTEPARRPVLQCSWAGIHR